MKTTQRRTFMKQTAALGAGMLMFPKDVMMMKSRTGIQLYTVRSMMEKDPGMTLSMLAQIGYREVECAGYGDGKFYGMSPSAFKELLKKNKLSMPSGHYQTGITMPDQKGTLTNGWLQAVKDAAAVGQKYMVLAYLHEGERKTLEQYNSLVKLIADCARICKDYGVQFAYHNHDFEFMSVEGVVPYDLLLSETDANLVKMELDLFWTVKAGYKPVELFEKNPGRFPLWHVKDINDAGNFTEVGTGNIDFKSIFKASKVAGLDHFFVEQDQISGDVKESIVTSYSNVQQFI
ncbi:sugar phosphate isomerase/epimerase family protein [Fulvivirga sedimenti]|uniref:Sugar phosphate isomerase/epimerase n=1 Tax=Fulvivirga sedimenti TaxID=2879465 RepID=A0A9X1HYW9_9BACT|nr:sugar phosphate isomerase/epimerase [Fulvivirga sedimenti]MCA6079162.1 sugar phosphate isomerase/epimerase [Fulvivirga sedimenti]